MRPTLPPGLYGMADATFGDPVLLGRALARGGCRVVQLRAKQATPAERLAMATALLQALADTGALLVVNDDVEVAARSGAHGVHLGQGDGELARARARLGPDALIGRSTHDLAQVDAAVAEGADYIGFGPVFPTRTKVDADPVVGLEGLARACARSGVPVVAIGGLRREELARLATCGAHGWAVVWDLLRHAVGGERALVEAAADFVRAVPRAEVRSPVRGD